MSEITRRTALAAAWSIPVAAIAIGVPQAAASTVEPPYDPCADEALEYTLVSQSASIAYVAFTPNAIHIFTIESVPDAIDVTLRWGDGTADYSRNYVTQGKNPGDNQVLYIPGEIITIPVHKTPKRCDGDWFQVKDLHITEAPA